MLTYFTIFILFFIIVVYFVFFYYNKNKEFLDNNNEENDNMPKTTLKNYELECRECCLKNRNKKNCVKNCFSSGFKCLCC